MTHAGRIGLDNAPCTFDAILYAFDALQKTFTQKMPAHLPTLSSA